MSEKSSVKKAVDSKSTAKMLLVLSLGLASLLVYLLSPFSFGRWVYTSWLAFSFILIAARLLGKKTSGKKTTTWPWFSFFLAGVFFTMGAYWRLSDEVSSWVVNPGDVCNIAAFIFFAVLVFQIPRAAVTKLNLVAGLDVLIIASSIAFPAWAAAISPIFSLPSSQHLALLQQQVPVVIYLVFGVALLGYTLLALQEKKRKSIGLWLIVLVLIFLTLSNILYLPLSSSHLRLHMVVPINEASSFLAFIFVALLAVSPWFDEVLDKEHPVSAPLFGQQVLMILATIITILTPILSHAHVGSDRTVRVVMLSTIISLIVTRLLIANRKISKQEALSRLYARHDSLTGIFNRAGILDALNTALLLEPKAVLFLDLDGFKDVNDTWGHDTGDEVLQEVTRRVSSVLEPASAFGRLGGDEFVIITLPDEEHVKTLAFDIKEVLRGDFFPSKAGVVRIGVSIGAAFALKNSSADDVLNRSDVAMLHVKQSGKGSLQFFNEQLGLSASRKALLRTNLHGAVERGEVFVNFQPIVSLKTGNGFGYEALARWSSPVLGVVPPEEFIRAAEADGHIVDIGCFVLRESCRALAAAMLKDPSLDTHVSINASVKQLESREFVSFVKETLLEFNIPPACVWIEVTESLLIENTVSVQNQLEELCAFGITIVIDDFGSGYAALSYLRDLPAKVVKLDKSFIDGITKNEHDEIIIKGVLKIAKELGLVVVAEGVENESQHIWLKDAGCTFGQGFLYGKASSVIL